MKTCPSHRFGRRRWSASTLPVDGNFEVFHLNGANPITTYTGLVNSNNSERTIAWDKNSHMYLLTSHSVDIYDITPASYTELKPWEFTDPYSMIVLSLQ